MPQTVTAAESFELPPDSRGSAAAFSRMGYDLETALADLIDNSIDAKAGTVEITLIRDEEGIAALTISDDGRGMTADALREAMQFAGVRERGGKELGVFGLGLKAASFSQCNSLTVLSKSAASVSACRWTVEGISDNWRCERLNGTDAQTAFRQGYSTMRVPRRSGTVVLWERLDRLDVSGDVDEFVSELLAGLELRLGLIFHRYIKRDALKILIGSRDLDGEPGFPRSVRAHDPFAYPRSGRTGYPKRFTAEVPRLGQLTLDAHIWPAMSVQPEFRLGRRNGTPHQGIYIYRNDRLVQAGGWNGVVKDASDAELSLARVAVDLPASAIRDVSVQKSGVQLTAALAQSLRAATAGKTSLTGYLDDARKTYRAGRRQPRADARIPPVPGLGLPAAVRRTLGDKLAPDGFSREIAFEWASLPKSQVFMLVPEDDRILLNRKYRQQILGAGKASATDVPVVKLLLFLLLEAEFDRERFSAQRKAWLKRCNAVLVEAVKRK
ncbi:ATP-binding protein [Sphingomonas sp.]|uniref:ATP-binding protein n=1 Tax=Sphingomonas sp. TaxID=28214 RepID=UPI001B05002A|nr:ATP-binding protein [Sphingomonas sp.]MBO9712472.1 ATP-binding protein [Sphingomonas sp.]